MATAKLWLWAVPGLLILALVGLARARSDIRIRLMAWSAALTFFAYLFLPADQGHGWGYRYFHSVWFVLPLLAVLSIWPSPIRSNALRFRGPASELPLGGSSEPAEARGADSVR